MSLPFPTFSTSFTPHSSVLSPQPSLLTPPKHFSMSQPPALVVAQITDTHLFADQHQSMKGCVTARTLQAVLDHLGQVQPQPDLLLMTGDLSQDETAASYADLRDRITALGIPAYWIPGNHDIPALMEQVLVSRLISPEKTLQIAGWHCLLLNSAQPNRVEGELSPETLNWLEQQLQQNYQPTLIALHHPPLSIGAACMDAIKLHNAEDLFAVIERHSQVKLVVFGHIHQEFEQQRHGVSYLGTPSTCIQIALQDEFVIDDRAPGFRLLYLQTDGSFSTEVKRVSPA